MVCIFTHESNKIQYTSFEITYCKEANSLKLLIQVEQCHLQSESSIFDTNINIVLQGLF